MLIWPPAKRGGDTQAEGEREADDVSLEGVCNGLDPPAFCLHSFRARF